MENIPDPFNDTPDDTARALNAYADRLESEGTELPATEMDVLQAQLRMQAHAIAVMAQQVIDLSRHIVEHHDVIQAHARTLSTLEALMIGGENELPA